MSRFLSKVEFGERLDNFRNIKLKGMKCSTDDPNQERKWDFLRLTVGVWPWWIQYQNNVGQILKSLISLYRFDGLNNYFLVLVWLSACQESLAGCKSFTKKVSTFSKCWESCLGLNWNWPFNCWNLQALKINIFFFSDLKTFLSLLSFFPSWSKNSFDDSQNQMDLMYSQNSGHVLNLLKIGWQ